jgi:hypothetical protein
MSQSEFEWQIDDAQVPAAMRPRPPRRRRRAWWLLALALLPIVAAVPAAWWVRRAQESQAEQRAAILALARLEDELIAQGDLDARRALLDGEYPGWSEWHSEHEHALSDAPPGCAGLARQVVALHWGQGSRNTYALYSSEYGAVELAGREATLPVVRRYTTCLPGDQPAVTFALTHTQYYRLTDGGWLRTGPPAPIWTQMISVQSAALEVIFPAHDRATVEPLIGRLIDLAGRACAELGCGAGRAVLLVGAYPRDLLAPPAGAMPMVRVPAPALTGVPGDAAGRDALYRLYAIGVVNAIAAERAAGRPESMRPWLQWELARLELEDRLAEEPLRHAAEHALQQGLDPLSTGSDAAVWLALDFLAEDEGANPLAELLAAPGRRSVRSQLVGQMEERTFRWWAHLDRIADLKPIYPGQAQLAVVCDGQATLWDATTQTLRPLGVDGAELIWSPDGSKVVASYVGDRFAVLTLADGRLQRSPFPFIGWMPDSRGVAQLDGSQRMLWELDTLRQTELVFGTGVTAWSPDGNYLAYTRGPVLFLADAWGRGGQALGRASWAAWSADSRYLLAKSSAALTPTLTIYGFGTATELVAPQGMVGIDTAWWPVIGRRPLLAVAWSPPGDGPGESLIQVLDAQGLVLREWTVPGGLLFGLRWSPDGQDFGWAQMAGGKTQLYLAHLNNENFQRFDLAPVRSSADFHWGWSPDGWWLAYESNGVAVWSRDLKSERHLPHACGAPAWRPEGGSLQ